VEGLSCKCSLQYWQKFDPNLLVRKPAFLTLDSLASYTFLSNGYLLYPLGLKLLIHDGANIEIHCPPVKIFDISNAAKIHVSIRALFPRRFTFDSVTMYCNIMSFRMSPRYRFITNYPLASTTFAYGLFNGVSFLPTIYFLKEYYRTEQLRSASGRRIVYRRHLAIEVRLVARRCGTA